MDIRTAYDWGRVAEWFDSDVTAATIRNAIAFLIVWWLARGPLRPAPVDIAPTRDHAWQVHDRCAVAARVQSCKTGITGSANCDDADWNHATIADRSGCCPARAA